MKDKSYYEIKSNCGVVLLVEEGIGSSRVKVEYLGSVVIDCCVNLDSFHDQGCINGVIDMIKGVEVCTN